MKSRLSSTVWTLVILNALAFFFAIGMAFYASRQANPSEATSLTSAASTPLVGGAIVLAFAMSALLA